MTAANNSLLTLDSIDADGLRVRDRLWPRQRWRRDSVALSDMAYAYIVAFDGPLDSLQRAPSGLIEAAATTQVDAALLEMVMMGDEPTPLTTLPPQEVLAACFADTDDTTSDGVPFFGHDTRAVKQYRLWLFSRTALVERDVVLIDARVFLRRTGVDVTQYRNEDAGEWCFSQPRLVWHVPSDAAEWETLYTPDYQQRVIEPRLVGSRAHRLGVAFGFVRTPPSSKAGVAIEQWCEANCARPVPRQAAFERELSCLAHMVVRALTEIEQLRVMHSSHRVMLLALLASTSAYWAHLGLRLHVLLCGEKTATKSHVLDELVALLIKGTVDVLTRETAAAGDVDVHENDVIKVMHEVPSELVARHAKKVPPEQTKFNELLTSGVTTVNVFVGGGGGGGGGRRTQRQVRSEKQFAWIGASNLLPEQLDSTVASRLVVLRQLPTAEHARPDCTLDDKMTADDHLSEPMRRAREAMVHSSRLTQACVRGVFFSSTAASALHLVDHAVDRLSYLSACVALAIRHQRSPNWSLHSCRNTAR
jgi:hypothetical protein